jgi:hypothetical protein
MGTFAGTAIVDYRLSFANQGKQTSKYRFRLQQIEGRFADFVFCLQQNKWNLPFMIYIYM